MPIVLKRSLYLNADKTRVLEEGDPEAAYVLGVEGTTISDEDAKAYGLPEYLKETKARVEQEPEEEQPEEQEPKATQPKANKAKQPDKNK